MKPRLLDLYCGAGGAAVGYARAGFDVVGVDIKPQPRYPFEFVCRDALEYLALEDRASDYFDAIHASPPCQAHSQLTRTATRSQRPPHADLIPETRTLLRATGLPYVIENVVGAPLEHPVVVCGSSLGLLVRRHRLFETNWTLMAPPCVHHVEASRCFSANRSDARKGGKRSGVVVVAGHDTRSGPINVTGSSGGKGGVALWREAMGIDWMSRDELAQAIPPAYTELIGHQLLQHVSVNTRSGGGS